MNCVEACLRLPFEPTWFEPYECIEFLTKSCFGRGWRTALRPYASATLYELLPLKVLSSTR